MKQGHRTLVAVVALVLGLAVATAGYAALSSRLFLPAIVKDFVAPATPTSLRSTPIPLAPAPPAPTPPTAGTGGDWLTYHADLARTGRAASTMPIQTAQFAWRTEDLDGDVYVEPLVWNGRVYIATENDTVYAVDAENGRTLWRRNIGEPVPRSQLPCGNIDPTGITGTPVIDPAAGRLYAVAFHQPGVHDLVAFDLRKGNVIFQRPIDAPNVDPKYHQQRAALTLANGLVYVSYGGRLGDCGPYHGWVLGAQATDGAVRVTYTVPVRREGGIWAPSGPSVDANGNLYVATGNGDSNTTFDYGNSVIRLTPDLQQADYFAPDDWAALNESDTDLGSVGPVLLDNGQVFQAGKAGVGYLLRAGQLGGIGGQAFSAQVCSGGVFGADAYAAPYVFVPCSNEITALRVDAGPRFSIAWRGPRSSPGPAIIVGGLVWSLDRSSRALVGMGPDDGQQRLRVGLNSANEFLPHFVGPSAGAGHLFVSTGRHVAAVTVQ